MGYKGNMSTCSRCRQQILWVQMQSGKKMPCDTRIVTYRIPAGGKGKEKIVTPNGMVVSADEVPSGTQDATGIGYISHFATCPAANTFRRK